jgi:KDO2-lipid IV(A) lauroyltransferase
VPLVIPVLRGIAAWIRDMSPASAYRLAVNLGLVFQALGLTRSIVRRNLEIACARRLGGPELRRFERDYYRHLGLLIVEFFRQPRVTPEVMARVFEPKGLAHARAVYDEGKGVIFVTGHAGVWELAGHAAGLAGINIISVAKLSGHPLIDGFVSGIRESGGQTIRDVRGSLWGMKKALDRKHAVGINVDQEARQGRVFAPFFGVPAATSNAPALLHLKTRAPILVVTAHREGRFRYALRVLDEIRHEPSGDREADLLAITTRINAGTEAAMRAHPDQWLWSHRRWRRRPEGEETLARHPGSPPLELN